MREQELHPCTSYMSSEEALRATRRGALSTTSAVRRRPAGAVLGLALALTCILTAPVAASGPDDSWRELPEVRQPGEPEPEWAPASAASIHPGVQVTGAGQCTANFVFYRVQRDEQQREYASHVFVGAAAHCFGGGPATETNGCVADYGTFPADVRIEGASQRGRLVYSSWRSMQEGSQTPTSSACAYNDFALIALNRADWASVNPSLPFWGGPKGPRGTSIPGSDVYSYGDSSLRLGLSSLSPKQGRSLGSSGSGWTHTVYMATPGIPGDSGSAVLDADGDALGVVSTLGLTPTPAANGVSDIDRVLTFARDRTGWDIRMALGTTQFTPLLPGS